MNPPDSNTDAGGPEGALTPGALTPSTASLQNQLAQLQSLVSAHQQQPTRPLPTSAGLGFVSPLPMSQMVAMQAAQRGMTNAFLAAPPPGRVHTPTGGLPSPFPMSQMLLPGFGVASGAGVPPSPNMAALLELQSPAGAQGAPGQDQWSAYTSMLAQSPTGAMDVSAYLASVESNAAYLQHQHMAAAAAAAAVAAVKSPQSPKGAGAGAQALPATPVALPGGNGGGAVASGPTSTGQTELGDIVLHSADGSQVSIPFEQAVAAAAVAGALAAQRQQEQMEAMRTGGAGGGALEAAAAARGRIRRAGSAMGGEVEPDLSIPSTLRLGPPSQPYTRDNLVEFISAWKFQHGEVPRGDHPDVVAFRAWLKDNSTV